jgi:hypothetical protein
VANIGELVVNLTANSTKLQSALKAAQKNVELFAAGAGAAAVAAVTRFMQVGSALDDMSQRTGVAASELSSLGFAAKMTDTSLEAVQGSLVKMQKFLGEVSDGTAAAVDTLDRLGITTQQLEGLTPDQQFKAFAEAISKVEDPTQKMNAAMGVFGKSAAEILPLLNEGASGIEAFQKEAERLGLVMSDDMATSAAQAADSIDALLLVANATAVRFGAALAPAITAVAKIISELVATSPKLFAAFAGGAVALAAVVSAFKVVNLAMDLYAKKQVLVLALSGPKGWAVLAGAALIAAGAFATVAMQTEQMNAEMAKAEKQQQRLGEGLQNAGQPASEMTGSAEAQSRIKAMQDELRVLRGEATAFDLELQKLSQAGATDRDLKQLRFMEMQRNRVLRLQEEERKKQQAIADEIERAARAAEQQALAMQGRAESIIEGLKTPLDKLMDREADIALLRANNLLTQAQAEQALQQARDEFRGPADNELRLPQAMQAGSQEAFRAILQAMGKQDPQVAAVNKMNQNIAKKLDNVTDAIHTIQTAGIA